jgi:hypothetical protein
LWGVLFTIVTPHVGTVLILRSSKTYLHYWYYIYIFLLSTGSEEGLGPLMRLIFSKFSKLLIYETYSS